MFKIYVGNLDYKVKVEQLRELFSVYAPIDDLVIPTDPKTNRAKGFAIVMIRDAELGRSAVKAMQGKRLLGRLLVVNEAVKRKKPGQAVLSKADLVRNGPFGPRMYRMGDPRMRTSRNPRRGQLGIGGAAIGSSPSAGTPLDAEVEMGDRSQSPTSPAPRPSAGTPPTGALPGHTLGSGGVSSSGSAASPRASSTRPSSPPTASAPSPPAQVPPVRPKAQRLAAPKRPAEGNTPSGGASAGSSDG